MFEIFKLNKKKKELEDQIAQLKADISSIQVEIDNYDEHRQIAAHQYENTMRSAKAAQSVLDAKVVSWKFRFFACPTSRFNAALSSLVHLVLCVPHQANQSSIPYMI